jgi:predicted transcriptional regulator YdeE
VPVSKNKKFSLNLNQYRNTNHHILNKAKINYKAIMAEQIQKLPKMERISINYTLYPATKRRTDIGNVVSVVKKFFEDSLVELGIIPDDDYTHIVKSTEQFGCVDKDNPRVEIEIIKLNY